MGVFHEAISAKQFWRFLKDILPVVAQIISARYYLDGDICNARLDSRPTFSWRSIFGVKDVIT